MKLGVEEELDGWPMDAKPAVVEIILKDGSRLTERVEYAKGNPRNPVSDDEILHNFRTCAAWAAHPLSGEKIDRALGLLGSLEEVENVDEIVSLFCAD